MNANMSTERLFLRSLDPKVDDFDNYLSWMIDLKTNSYIKSVREETTLEDLHSYVEFHNESHNSLLLGIFLKSGFKHVGNIKLEPIVQGEETTLGILIGEDEWRGKGIGFEVISRVIKYSFGELKLNKIQLGVDLNNIAAVRLYEKLGFKPEGKNQASSGIMMSLKKY